MQISPLMEVKLAATETAMQAALPAFGLWVAPGRLAWPVSRGGVANRQLGPGQIVYVTPPTYGPDGEVTDPGERDPRLVWPLTLDTRPFPGNERNAQMTPDEDLDAVIEAAWPGDPATLGDRLKRLADGWALSEDSATVVSQPVSEARLILRLWLTRGVASDDPVLGPVRTLAGVSLLLDP